MKRNLLIITGSALLILSLAGFNLNDVPKTIISEPIPEPRLLYPVTEEISLTGKEYLEFKWETTDFTLTRGYDFRLYKSYGTTASNLIFKRVLSNDKDSLKVKSSLFKHNEVYTWTLRRVGLGGKKSDFSSSSFRVTKR